MTRRLIMVALLAASLWQIGQGVTVQAKAWIGQALLERAWSSPARAGAATQPWPGAVSHPIARLRVPELAIDQLVLDRLDTPVLAWGPGMETGPNGHRIIAAHRDTHFRFLEKLNPGHRLELEQPDGHIEHWQVTSRAIVDARTTQLDMNIDEPLLTLVTCYPFTSTQPGGPLRLVVSLKPDETR